MDIRTRLRALTLATLLPVVAFGMFGTYVLVEREKETLERAMRDRARALMTAIDAELHASATPLQLLALSPSSTAATWRRSGSRRSGRSTRATATGSTCWCGAPTPARWC